MSVPNFEGIELKNVVQVCIDGIWQWIEPNSLEAKENNFIFKTNEGIYAVQGQNLVAVRTELPIETPTE